MRRPPAVLAARTLCVLAFVVAVTACNDKITDVGEDQAAAETSPELIPFATDDEDSSRATDDLDSQDDESEPDESTDEDDDGDKSDTDDADSDDESEDPAVEIDPMPGDTATLDTRPDDDPLCEAAREVVDANDAYQKQLDKALQTSPDNSAALVKALEKLPLERLATAYDDLSPQVPMTMRRRVTTIRNFVVEHGEDLADVEDFEQLSELIADIESDPAASKVTKATIAVSKYTEDECGIVLAQGG